MKQTILTQEIRSIQPDALALHDTALLTPRMSDTAYNALKTDIELQGQLEPVITYRGKIIDGRHRWLILQELGVPSILFVEFANNATLAQIKSFVHSKETRRHETQAQLAIRAYRAKIAPDSGYKSFTAAAESVGAEVSRVSEAKKIAEFYGRSDILELLFRGEKFNIGTATAPSYSESLGSICVWLSKYGIIQPTSTSSGKKLITPRVELTTDEQLLVTSYTAAICAENLLVVRAIVESLNNRLFRESLSAT